jgi:hypothetical protein
MTTTQQAPPDPNAFLMGGGVPSASFKKHGDKITGTICEPPITQQQRDYTTNEPKFWEDGNPMWHLVVTLQTDTTSDDIEDDDGRRRIYLKNNSKKAVSDAVREAGAKALEVGGILTLCYMDDGKAGKKGMQPPKLYEAEYVPPSQAALHDNRNEDAPPNTSAWTKAVMQAATVGITEAQLKAELKKSGFKKWDDACIPLVKALVAAKAEGKYKPKGEPLGEQEIPF